MTKGRSGKKVANSLVAVSSAAVLAVYAAGYARTRSAADRFDGQTAERRRSVPEPPRAVESAPPDLPAAPAPEPPPKPAAAEKAVTVAKAVITAEPVAAPVDVPVAVAVAPPPPPPPPPPAPVTVWKDGAYTGWGASRHGDIQASVVIEGGRIASASIAQCRTRYSCSVIDLLPPQVALRQAPDVDVISGATQSSDAFYYAVVEALGKAK